MKNKIIFSALISFVIFSFFNIAYADTTIHLKIEAPASIIYDQDIIVTPCNSDNASTPDLKVTPYCAILQSGIQNDWNWSWAPGAFLNSLGDVAGYTSKDSSNNDVYHYWSWYLNSEEGQTGLNQHELQLNDLIFLNFIDPVEPAPEPVEDPVPSLSNESNTPPPPVFNVQNAVNYLISVQDPDGSFDKNDMYTDWAGIAYSAGDVSDNSRDKLISYLNSHATPSSLLTDNERRAMVLLALEQNPYSFHDANYIASIVNSFDGKQFGDSSLVNDDIFALIPLAGASYTASDDMIMKDIDFVISAQSTDGSWDASVDMTAATIQALKPFDSVGGVSDALTKASLYLQNTQGTDGGWGNVSSTSWAMQAMNALDASWTKNGKSSLDYLATQQAIDGAVSPASETLQNRIWATSYAIPAALGKPWGKILHSVSKPILTSVVVNNENSSSTSTNRPRKNQPVENKTETVSEKLEIQVPVPAPVNISQDKKILATTLSTPKISPNVTKKIPLPVVETKEIPIILPAAAEKSETQMPILITIGSLVLIGSIVAFRFFKL